jgi:multidrug transporter EmrE-like cation transporter
MSVLTIGLIVFSISLSVIAQILLKHGMSNTDIHGAFDESVVAGVLSIATNLFVLSGLFVYFSSAAVWLGVLAKVDVSKAYPFVGLGFIGTMLVAYWFLNEPITPTKLIGTMLIVLGVFFISR